MLPETSELYYSEGYALGVREMQNGFEDILEDTTNLENKFYQEGYQSGFEHGQLHGLYEGRELGQEKAWEIWEEVGFYEGFALSWKDITSTSSSSSTGIKNKDKIMNHVNQLLVLISQYPITNPIPTPTLTPTPAFSSIEGAMVSGSGGSVMVVDEIQGKEVDMEKLLMSIRAKYRLMCMMIGTKPRLAPGRVTESQGESGIDGPGEGLSSVMEGIEGPMKGVDTTQLKF